MFVRRMKSVFNKLLLVKKKYVLVDIPFSFRIGDKVYVRMYEKRQATLGKRNCNIHKMNNVWSRKQKWNGKETYKSA